MESVRFLYQPNNQCKHYEFDELTMGELPWIGHDLAEEFGFTFSETPRILNDSWTVNLRSDMERALLGARTPVIKYNNIKSREWLKTDKDVFVDKKGNIWFKK